MRFLFTCGGTAGHINPALAELVPREGYEIREIEITNISREHSLEGLAHNLHTIKNVAVSTEKAKKIIREFKPDAVIGTGGYVCFPVLTAAARMHIPTLVHESNALPGLTTRLLAEKVDKVMVGFEDSRAHYAKPEKVTVTGTPVRGGFSSYTQESAKRQLGIPDDRPLVVSVWGSLGAGHMNAVMAELIPMMKADQSFRLIHAAGGMYYEELCGKLRRSAPDCSSFGADVRRYIYDMPRVMAPCRRVLSRRADFPRQARDHRPLSKCDEQPPGEERTRPRTGRRRKGPAGGRV